MNLQEIRQKYPDYNDMSDADFAQGFHKKFYSDMSFEDFSSKVGYSVKQDKPVESSWYEQNVPQPIKDAVGGYEAVGGMITGLPAMAESFIKKAYTQATATGTEEEKRAKAAQAAENPTLGALIYEPRTESGKVGTELLGKVGETIINSGGEVGAEFTRGQTFLNDSKLKNTGEVVPKYGKEGVEAGRTFGQLAAEGAMLAPVPGQVKSLINGFKNKKPKEPSAAAKAAAEFEAKKAAEQPKPTMVESPLKSRDQLMREDLERNLQEAGYHKGLESVPEEQPLPFVPELYKEQAPRIPKVKDKFQPTVTEAERIATEREQSLSKPLDFERAPVEPSITDFTLQEAGLPFSREGKLSAPVEMGTYAKSVQQGIRDVREIASEVEQLKTDLVDKTEVGPEQRMTIQSLEHDLENASGRTAANLEEVAQIGRDIAQLKIKTADGTKTPLKIMGQTGFGKGQRGSIGFFGKDPFEKFAENLRKEVPNVSDDAIKYAWDKQQAQATPAIEAQKQTTAQGQAYSNITGLDPKITGEVWTPEKAVEIFKTTPDIQDRSFLTEQVMSSGRLQRDLLNNPVTTQIYNLTSKAIEQARLRARQVLDDVNTGLIPKIRSRTILGGAKEMRDLMQWRFANEGLGKELPDTFSAKAKAINDSMNKADANLLSAMNEVLAKDGKKPITSIDNHMVHYWSGPYRAYIYLKTEAGGSKLGFFVSEKSMKDAQKAMAWIKENVPNVDLGKTTDVSFVKSDIRNRTSMFDHLLDISKEKDPVVLEALQAFKDRIEQGQATHLGEQHRQKYRAGVQGFSGNKPWFDAKRNYADTLDMVRTKYDAGYQWVAAQEIKQQMNPILEAQKNGEISVGKALMLGQRYIDHALGKNVDVSAITKFADYLEDISPTKVGPARTAMNEAQHIASRVTLPYLLALKGTQAVQAVLQVPMSTIPRMLELRQAWGGDYVNMGTALAHGSMDGLFQLANTLSGGKFESLTRELLQAGGKDLSETSIAIHRYMAENDIAKMSLSDAGASREGGFAKALGNYAADTFLNAPMNLFEGPTRSWAFSSYARQAVKDGHPIERALQIAHEQMDAMVNYNPEASAMMMSNLGVMGQEAKGLHTFMINYYSQLYRYVDLAKNQKQAGPLLAYLGLTFAAGGAVGFIGADLADWLLDGIKAAARGKSFDTPDLQKLSVRKWLMENTPEAVSVGPLSTTTGLGLYGSFTTKVVDPERSFLENTFPKTTASIQIAKGIAQSPKLFNENLSQKERGTIIENMSPKYLTQTLRNRYQNKDGVVYDPNADRAGLPMYQRTDKEQKISERGFGVRGLAENMSQEDMLQYYKGTKNVTEAEKAQLTKLDSLLVAAIKTGKEPTEFQKKAISDQSSAMIAKWGMGEDKLQKHIEQLAEAYGIPADSLRKLVTAKDKTLKDVSKIQDLSAIVNRQKERQQRYGQWN